jgi:hypothetical protein
VRHPLPRSNPAGRAGLLAALALAAAVGCFLALALAVSPAMAKDVRPAKPQSADAPTRPPVAITRAARRAKKTPVARASLCTTPTMSGDWRNINPNTSSITRNLIDFRCSDVILCDTNGNCAGGDSGYFMRPFGKCHPSDCDWGRLRADDMGGGWIRSIYNHSWASKHVWAKTYSYYGLTYLRVWAHTDFTAADGRTDYTTDEWFLR